MRMRKTTDAIWFLNSAISAMITRRHPIHMKINAVSTTFCPLVWRPHTKRVMSKTKQKCGLFFGVGKYESRRDINSYEKRLIRVTVLRKENKCDIQQNTSVYHHSPFAICLYARIAEDTWTYAHNTRVHECSYRPSSMFILKSAPANMAFDVTKVESMNNAKFCQQQQHDRAKRLKLLFMVSMKSM